MSRNNSGVALTYYDILGASPTDDAFALRRAYHVKSLLLHPDRHHGAAPEVVAAASQAMAELNRAYAVLRDPESRRLYDEGIEFAPSVQPAPAPKPVAAAPARRTKHSWWRDPAPARSQFVALA